MGKLQPARPGLKRGMKNGMFQSEIGSGFGEPGGTPLLRIPGSAPPGNIPSLISKIVFILLAGSFLLRCEPLCSTLFERPNQFTKNWLARRLVRGIRASRTSK